MTKFSNFLNIEVMLFLSLLIPKEAWSFTKLSIFYNFIIKILQLIFSIESCLCTNKDQETQGIGTLVFATYSIWNIGETQFWD